MLAGIGAVVMLIIVVIAMMMNKQDKAEPIAAVLTPVTTATPAPEAKPSTPPPSEPVKTEPVKPAPKVEPKPAEKKPVPSAPPGPVTMKPVPAKTPAKTPEKAPAKTAPAKPARTTPAPQPATPVPAAPPANAGAMATLTVKATPFAQALIIDGDTKGQNQSQFKVQLKPGKHTIKLTHTTAAAYETTVDLDAGEEHTITHDFAGNFGSISVTADPTWGEIYIDGDPQGKTTPFVVGNLRPKEYQVVLVRDGFTVEGGAQFVTVKPGQTVTVKFKMKKKK